MNEDVKKEENMKKKDNFLKKKEVWISGIIGLVLGVGIMCLMALLGLPNFGHEVVAKFKGGKITEAEVYDYMEKYDISSQLLQVSESKLLDRKYKLTEKQKQEINDEINSVIEQYKTDDKSEEEIYKMIGFKSREQLVAYLEESYKRELCVIDYLKTKISKEDIEAAYNEMAEENRPSFEDAEKEIIETLAEDLDIDTQFAVYKALIDLGQEYGLKFKDKDMQKQYEEYRDQINALISNDSEESETEANSLSLEEE